MVAAIKTVMLCAGPHGPAMRARSFDDRLPTPTWVPAKGRGGSVSFAKRALAKILIYAHPVARPNEQRMGACINQNPRCIDLEGDVPSGWTRRHVVSSRKKTGLDGLHEDMSSSGTRRRVCLFSEKPCPLVGDGVGEVALGMLLHILVAFVCGCLRLS